jgi:hypothetical protein
VLSIRRRQGPHAFGEAASFGRSERGWPGWGELAPILLRSVGIAGVAGIIMVIAAGNALFTEPHRAPRTQTQAFVASEREIAAAVPVASVFAPQAPAEARPVEPLAFAAAPAVPAAKPAEMRLELRGNIDPDASPDPPPGALPAAPRPVVAAGPSAAVPEATKLPTAAIPTKVEAAASSAAGAAVQPAADGTEIEVAALSSADRTGNDVADADTGESPEGGSLWANAAVACPRDWLDGADPDFTDELSADCEPKFVLVAPVPTAGDDAEPEEWSLEDALESAATTRAIRLSGFVARLPIPRPDPPPVRKVRTSHRADWPASPPPDCGTLHAYWRFVDRKAGTKEWYCR